jgi:hypothetical protein
MKARLRFAGSAKDGILRAELASSLYWSCRTWFKKLKQNTQFHVSESISSRRMQLQGGACRLNASSMQHKSAKEAQFFKSVKVIQVGENISQRMKRQEDTCSFKAANAGSTPA